MRTTVKLVTVEHYRTITKDSDPDFWFLLQQGVLLAMRSDGNLTQMQYRNAEYILKQQSLAIIRSAGESGGEF